MHIHHIGYLVKKIEKAIISFENLGYKKESDIVHDSLRDIHICFLKKEGYCVELVSPASKNSVVANLIKTYRNTPYHICYETENFEKDLEDLTKNGYVVMANPCPAPALDNKRVVFLMNATIGIIELLEI